VADELRRQADEFIDLVHLMPRIGRDPAERQMRSENQRRHFTPVQQPVEEPVRE